MNFNDLYPSKYLKKEDVPSPIHAVIASVSQQNVGRQDKPEQKPVVTFQGGSPKPMVLNKRNGRAMAQAWGDNINNWIGKTVEIYADPTVEFGGEVVGGLRIRVPTGHGITEWTFQEACDEAAKAGLTREDLIAHLKEHGFTGYKPSRDTASIKAFILSQNDDGEESFDDAPRDEEIPF